MSVSLDDIAPIEPAPLEIAAAAPSPTTDMDVAPFALLRAATLPYRYLESLACSRTDSLLERIVDAEHAMERQREPLELALHDLVPKLDRDPSARRRQVLELRRDIHNGRPGRLADEDIAWIGQRLDRAPALLLSHWLEARSIVARAEAELAVTLTEELTSLLRPTLREPLAVPMFARGLAFASPSIARAALDERKLPQTRAPTSLERSLLGYLARAAAKTSPFSSFMSLSVLPIAPQRSLPPPRAPQPHYESVVDLNRGSIARLDDLTRVKASSAPSPRRLGVNATLRAGKQGRAHALCMRDVILLGRPWAEQRLAQFRLAPTLLATLQQTEAQDLEAWAALLAQSTGIDHPAAADLVRQLLTRGLLDIEARLDAFTAAPAAALADAWEASQDPMLVGLCSRIRSMEGKVRALDRAPTRERIVVLETLRQDEAVLLDAIGGADAAPLQNLVTEDCWLHGVEGALAGRLLEPLGELRRHLAAKLIVSPYYDRLRALFIDMFGSGGRADNLVEFLLLAGDKVVDIPEFGAKAELPPAIPAPSGAMLPVTAQVQIAMDAQDGPLMVVNRVFEGAGWLAARFTRSGQTDRQDLARHLSTWLGRIAAPAEPLDIAIAGHCSALQAHTRLTRRVLRWPGEKLALPSEAIVEAGELDLRHDPVSNLLTLSDRSGRPVHPTYLGATFPSPIWGLRYILAILAQPWLVDRPSFEPPSTQGQSIFFVPRLRHGRLILRRATWWVTAAYLRANWFAAEGARQLLAVRRDRERHCLPRIVYAQRYQAPERNALVSADMLKAERKPLWLDLNNPFWLAMLQRMTETAGWIRLTEPLPAGDQLWLHIAGERHASELQLELMVRAAPNLTGARI